MRGGEPQPCDWCGKNELGVLQLQPDGKWVFTACPIQHFVTFYTDGEGNLK